MPSQPSQEDNAVSHKGRCHGVRSQSYGGLAAGRSSISLNHYSPHQKGAQRPSVHSQSELASVLQGSGSAAAPTSSDDKYFIKVHIRRRILPNTKDSVIVPIDFPNSSSSSATAPSSLSTTARSPRILTERGNLNSSIVATGVNNNQQQQQQPHQYAVFAIGNKTFDVPDRRCKKAVEVRAARVVKPRPLLGKTSEAASILPGRGFGVACGRENGASPVPLLPGHKAGKHIEKQTIPKQDGDDDGAIRRFTRPPFWDEQSKPPRGYEYALPTRNFQAPKMFLGEKQQQRQRQQQQNPSTDAEDLPSTSRSQKNLAAGRASSTSSAASRSASSPCAPSSSSYSAAAFERRNSSSQLDYLFSPNRLIARKKNESVVDECLLGRVQPGQPLKRTLVDHDAHRSRGWMHCDGRIKTRPRLETEVNVYVPTLANRSTRVFRYCRPENDHSGKSTNGFDRRNKSSDALAYGENFASGSADVRSLREHPVGRPYSRQVRASTPQPRSSSSSSSLVGERFARCDTSSSSIEAPFDRSTNTGKYDITYESRTTCKPWKPYVRPLLFHERR